MKYKKIPAGFTVLEIIAALTVMFVGLIGICALFPASFRMTELSKANTRITIIGQSKMDELISLGFANLAPGTYPIADTDLARFEPNQHERNRYNNSEITITDLDAENPLNNRAILRQIDVTIAYEIRSGKQKTETFTTYISNPLHG